MDALAEYAVQDVSSEADRPNPERKGLEKALSKARGEVVRLRAELGEAAESARARTMRGFKIAQAKLRRELKSAKAKAESLRAEYSQLPARVSASDLKALTTEKKLIVDTIKMSAYQVETGLLGLLEGSYSRSSEEGRTLLHAAFQTPGKVKIGRGELRITLQPQSSAHRTNAITILCDQLNQLGSCFPGTNLRLQFVVQSQKPADL